MQSFCCYFFCQSKSAANQRTNLLYFSRGINVETESWIGLLFTIYDCIMPKVQEQEGKKADLSWFCQVCRHVVSDRSNNSGASWPSLIYTQLYQTSEPFHLTVVSLTENRNFLLKKKKRHTPRYKISLKTAHQLYSSKSGSNFLQVSVLFYTTGLAVTSWG